MKVSELANELGRTSKEIIEVIKKKEGTGALYAASTMTKEQESAARSAFAAKKEDGPKAAPQPEAPQGEGRKAETAKGEAPKEPAKKRLTAVFRPQNAQQQIKRSLPPKPQAGRSQAEAPTAKPQVQPKEEKAQEIAESIVFEK